MLEEEKSAPALSTGTRNINFLAKQRSNSRKKEVATAPSVEKRGITSRVSDSQVINCVQCCNDDLCKGLNGLL